VSQQNFVLFALQIATLLGCALFFGQVMRRFNQPAVLGEMVGGILLGPTILGALFPGFYFWLFQSSPAITGVRDASIKLGMLFFLFIAGMEVNLSDLRKLGKRAGLIGLAGTLVPLGAGVALVYLVPREFWGPQVNDYFFAFALFVGMNLANSANPVVARILMDLGLLKAEIGTMVMTATIIDDLLNWTLFAVILRDFAPAGTATTSLPVSIGLVICFFVVVLGGGRWLRPRALPWVRRNVSWPSGFIAVTALLILVAGAVAESLGIHAFLGAFLVGAALGGNGTTSEVHLSIKNFVLSFFAPIYFVSMGLNANFVTNLDVPLVLLVTGAAFLSKFAGVFLGAWLAGMRLSREVVAIGFGLNARGATGIILAGVGLEFGVIDERIFVTMVVMALVTSLVSGPAIKQVLAKRAPAAIPALEKAVGA
jgi:Kef-type K+ transport system membrane component KefB